VDRDGVGENEPPAFLVGLLGDVLRLRGYGDLAFFFRDHSAIPHDFARPDKGEAAWFHAAPSESK
jgi:hypothetical protein